MHLLVFSFAPADLIKRRLICSKDIVLLKMTKRLWLDFLGGTLSLFSSHYVPNPSHHPTVCIQTDRVTFSLSVNHRRPNGIVLTQLNSLNWQREQPRLQRNPSKRSDSEWTLTICQLCGISSFSDASLQLWWWLPTTQLLNAPGSIKKR